MTGGRDGAAVFRDEVLDHYRTRGYRLNERVKVRGRSGAVHACDLVAQGPLGNLMVTFGDESGFDGPELASLKRTARDVGAGAVVAVPEASATVRDWARRHGVKVLDRDALEDWEPMTVEQIRPEAEDHPWPEQEPLLRRAARGGDAAQGLWKHRRADKAGQRDDQEKSGFGWLRGGEAAPAADAPDGGWQEREVAAPAAATRPAQRPMASASRTDPPQVGSSTSAAPRAQPVQPWAWKWVWAPILWGAATGGTLYLLFRVFG